MVINYSSWEMDVVGFMMVPVLVAVAVGVGVCYWNGHGHAFVGVVVSSIGRNFCNRIEFCSGPR